MKITRNLFARHPVKRSTLQTASFAKQQLLKCSTSNYYLHVERKHDERYANVTFKYQLKSNSITLLRLGDMTIQSQHYIYI